MKETQVLFVHPDAGWQIVCGPTDRQFRTPELGGHPWIASLCARVPWMYQMQAVGGGPVRNLPPGYFATYYRCTARRPYENPYIEDLYWLHEIAHLDTWRPGGVQDPPARYGREESWLDWSERAIDSELVAAVTSECLPHLIPGVREKAFRHPIWVDRYLRNQASKRRHGNEDWRAAKRRHEIEGSWKKWCERAARDPESARAVLAAERRRVLEGNQKFNDYVERQVGGYYETNHLWTVLMANETVGYGPYADLPAFRCVENHLRDNDPDRRKNREAHLQWLADVTPTKKDLKRLGLPAEYQLPFALQAKSFGDVFKTYADRFGNAVFFK